MDEGRVDALVCILQHILGHPIERKMKARVTSNTSRSAPVALWLPYIKGILHLYSETIKQDCSLGTHTHCLLLFVLFVRFSAGLFLYLHALINKANNKEQFSLAILGV